MYPFLRLGYEIALARGAPPLAIDGVHVSTHTCLPWDLDFWFELNNGRALSLYDLGRIPLFMRTGAFKTLKRQGWGLTIAGSTVRYRRRVRAFDRLELRSALIGRDARFLYIHHAMWRGGEAVSAGVFRGAATGPDGMVPTDAIMAAHGTPDWSPALPAWIEAWSAAEALRPWPPAP